MQFYVLTPIALLIAASCGPSISPHEHPKPLSVQEHQQHASEHDRRAAELGGEADDAAAFTAGTCVDQSLPLESGGERTQVMTPCWTPTQYLFSAAEESRAAKDHRIWATQLAKVERSACEGLGETDIRRDPFTRSGDIITVSEFREANQLHGARVEFRKVEGLSVDWLNRSLRCHQARAAALGYPEEFMKHSPVSLQHVAMSVTNTGATITVSLRSTDELVATKIYGRALHAKENEVKEDQ